MSTERIEQFRLALAMCERMNVEPYELLSHRDGSVRVGLHGMDTAHFLTVFPDHTAKFRRMEDGTEEMCFEEQREDVVFYIIRTLGCPCHVWLSVPRVPEPLEVSPAPGTGGSFKE